ncbi:MAG: hypothetical protein JSV42_15220 [Chloroflexota bacterium]|nr:MAG: hypothetical protein JSV42_15220 [Chloroflexota bacterium]
MQDYCGKLVNQNPPFLGDYQGNHRLTFHDPNARDKLKNYYPVIED